LPGSPPEALKFAPERKFSFEKSVKINGRWTGFDLRLLRPEGFHSAASFHERVDRDTVAAQEGVGHELQWSDIDVAAATSNQSSEIRVQAWVLRSGRRVSLAAVDV